MSHAFDAMCETHREVIGESGCPERGCYSNHGSTLVACRRGCPKYVGLTPAEQEMLDKALGQ